MANLWKRHRRGGRAAVFLATLMLAAILACQTMVSATGGGINSLLTYSDLIRMGQRGDLVTSLQEALNACGYKIGADGIFGPNTQSTVKSFQKDNGLYVDGVVGPSTLSALSKHYYRANPPEKHIVKRGESLSSIGSMYGLDVDDLMRANKLVDPDLVYAGQVLLLQAPPKEPVLQPETPSPQAPETESPPDLEPTTPQFPAPTQRICLTFDDGPDLTTTRPILAILRQYGVKATFFLIGHKVLQHPELVKEIALDGHVIGVHGFEHKVLAGLPATEVESDLWKAQEAINQVAGTKPWLYRPPSGALDQPQVIQAAKLGLQVVMWTNIGGADLGATSPGEVVTRTVSAATDGGIIMLHEGLQHTVEALPSVIEALARLGFGFQNPSK